MFSQFHVSFMFCSNERDLSKIISSRFSSRRDRCIQLVVVLYLFEVGHSCIRVVVEETYRKIRDVVECSRLQPNEAQLSQE